MNIVSFITGLLAVAFFLLSYLQRRRRNIVVFNFTSRILYIIQYLLLGALEGVVLDVLGALSTFLAQKRSRGFTQRYSKYIFISINILVIISGLALYKNIFSLLPIVGVLLQTDALWLNNEKYIRLISMAGCPFWFTYNFASGAYGSCIGDFLALVSLSVAFIHYNVIGKENETQNKNDKKLRS